jgi:hypothetical protein
LAFGWVVSALEQPPDGHDEVLQVAQHKFVLGQVVTTGAVPIMMLGREVWDSAGWVETGENAV